MGFLWKKKNNVAMNTIRRDQSIDCVIKCTLVNPKKLRLVVSYSTLILILFF